MDEGNVTEDWQFREKKFNEEVGSTLEHYAVNLRKTWRRQRFISVIVTLCSVFAPLLVVGSTLDEAFGFSEAVVKGAAVVVTLILAISEGLKRIFRFERRWAAIYWARAAIKRARSDYRIAQIGLPIGSEHWIVNFKKYRDIFLEAIDVETREFFDAVATSAADGRAE